MAERIKHHTLGKAQSKSEPGQGVRFLWVPEISQDLLSITQPTRSKTTVLYCVLGPGLGRRTEGQSFVPWGHITWREPQSQAWVKVTGTMGCVPE